MAEAAEEKTEPLDAVRVAVLGAGAFGTAMATIAARRGHQVLLYTRDESQAKVGPLKHSVLELPRRKNPNRQ